LIAKTLALGGCGVFVRCESSFDEILNGVGNPGQSERQYCAWLYGDETLHIVDDIAHAPDVDVLLYEIGPNRPERPDELQKWMREARSVVAWNMIFHEQGFRANLRAEIATIVKFRRFLPFTRAVVMFNGSPCWRSTALLKRAEWQGYFVHPKFLREESLRKEMFDVAWSPDERRPVRLVFSGNPQPDTRMRLVNSVRSFLASWPAVRLVDHFTRLSDDARMDGDRVVLWMVRADPNDPKWDIRDDVVPPSKWPAILRLCDFAFCPPGHERKTHRVIESLLQGVIPILDCPEDYDIGLRDGENCLVVRRGDWIASVQKALEMAQPEIRRMRQVVLSVARNHLHHAGAAQDWLKKLGLVGAAGSGG
jgi:hypothetical protein